MTAVPFIDDKPNRTYDGIGVGIGSIFVAMGARVRFKGWERAVISYDVANHAISFKKAKKRTKDENRTYKVAYGSISSRIHRVMPEGRYLFSEKQKDGSLVFVQEWIEE